MSAPAVNANDDIRRLDPSAPLRWPALVQTNPRISTTRSGPLPALWHKLPTSSSKQTLAPGTNTPWLLARSYPSFWYKYTLAPGNSS
eukprot:2436995-Rhodomonas_salina.1